MTDIELESKLWAASYGPKRGMKGVVRMVQRHIIEEKLKLLDSLEGVYIPTFIKIEKARKELLKKRNEYTGGHSGTE
jgi:hypothetical protein